MFFIFITNLSQNLLEQVDAWGPEFSHHFNPIDILLSFIQYTYILLCLQALRKLTRKNCKCFGYSGTCTQEACWRVLPSFSHVGSVLKERFDSASKVYFDNKGDTFHYDETMKKPTAEDLVYTRDSPSFCEPDPEVGSLGTKGRYCNVSSMGTDGCDIMCCGRDFKISVERSERYCDCVFHWCCSVKCRTCHVEKTVYTCR